MMMFLVIVEGISEENAKSSAHCPSLAAIWQQHIPSEFHGTILQPSVWVKTVSPGLASTQGQCQSGFSLDLA